MGYRKINIQENHFNGLKPKKKQTMSHSFNKIWIHAIWATKERMPFIHQNIYILSYDLFFYIGDFHDYVL